jgi:hypothetical protein
MKKALVGISVLCFFIILAGATLSLAENRKRATCNQLETLSPIDDFNKINLQKRYALQFPVR